LTNIDPRPATSHLGQHMVVYIVAFSDALCTSRPMYSHAYNKEKVMFCATMCIFDSLYSAFQVGLSLVIAVPRRRRQEILWVHSFHCMLVSVA